MGKSKIENQRITRVDHADVHTLRVHENQGNKHNREESGVLKRKEKEMRHSWTGEMKHLVFMRASSESPTAKGAPSESNIFGEFVQGQQFYRGPLGL